jgi:hypothetical protein
MGSGSRSAGSAGFVGSASTLLPRGGSQLGL